jgi:quercetin dioxygenase-like cupin family protein
MRSIRLILIAAAVAACSKGTTVSGAPSPTLAGDVAGGKQLQWGPVPPVFEPGAQMAVLEGDPSKNEPFTVRLRLPDGYRIAPHTHPTTENVTVLSGAFLAGMGDRVAESTMETFGPGDFASIPANHAHYAKARGATVVQVHAMGPFALTYVNPADAPRAR